MELQGLRLLTMNVKLLKQGGSNYTYYPNLFKAGGSNVMYCPDFKSSLCQCTGLDCSVQHGCCPMVGGLTLT